MRSKKDTTSLVDSTDSRKLGCSGSSHNEIKEDCSGTTDNTKEASAELDSKMIKEKQIKLDIVYLLGFSIKIALKTTSPLQTDNFLPKKQICENCADKCLVMKHDKGSVFGSRYSEPDDCMVKQNRQTDEALIDMILDKNFSP